MRIPERSGFYIVEGTGRGVLRVAPGYFHRSLEPAECLRDSNVAGFLVANSAVDLSKAGVCFGELFCTEHMSDIEECFASSGVQYIPLWALRDSVGSPND